MTNEKKNPVFELQKELIKHKYILGVLDVDGSIESNDKIYYDITNKIYTCVKDDANKVTKMNRILMFGGGILLGALIGVIIMLII